MDITQLILDDHHEQRGLFAILDEIADDDTVALSAVWRRLSALLGTHAKAEEVLFYPQLLVDGRANGQGEEARSETKDAIKDHNEIREAIAEVGKARTGSKEWREALRAVNKANGDHMAEEEREGLTLFRQQASLAERHELAVAFIRFEVDHLEGVTPANPDPETWVEQHEGKA